MYKVGEMSLSKYCILKKIPYECVWNRITFKGMTVEQAVEDFLSKRNNPHYCKFYYKGTTLRKYCAMHGLKYQQIIDYKRFYDISLEEVVEKFLTKKK